MTEDTQLDAGEIERRTIDFIERELLEDEVSVTSEDDLLSGELLDSIAILRLAAFVEDEFHFQIEPADHVIENFQNVALLAAFVQRAIKR
jgi:acyl carrier protein